MDYLSRRIDPRFARPLAELLRLGPLDELEIRARFLRDVPNRSLSLRSLQALLELSAQGGLLVSDNGLWRLGQLALDSLLRRCFAFWSDPANMPDNLFRNRSAVCLDRGLLSAHAEYRPMAEIAASASLSPVEWAGLVSGPIDVRLLSGRESKHVEADCLMLYRNADASPICDADDVVPRIERRLLPPLPAAPEVLQGGLVPIRESWNAQLNAFLGDACAADFSRFIVYAKDLLDLFFWGRPMPLRSTIAAEDLPRLSERVQRYGLKAEDFSIAWRSIPALYRAVSRLSWGERYLSNNLSHPQPPPADAQSFLRICGLPSEKQSAISAARSGQSLLTLTRSLRVFHRALAEWRGREPMIASSAACAAAVVADHLDDKLQRRAFADRIRRLHVIPSVYLLDAFAQEVSPPLVPEIADPALSAAAVISNYSAFIESAPGNAYAEVRLTLHAELDFKGRFNVHSLSPSQRYEGVWRTTIQELVTNVETARHSAQLLGG